MVRNEEPRATFSFFLCLGRWNWREGLREDGNSTGAGTCGEVIRVLVESVYERDYWCV